MSKTAARQDGCRHEKRLLVKKLNLLESCADVATTAEAKCQHEHETAPCGVCFQLCPVHNAEVPAVPQQPREHPSQKEASVSPGACNVGGPYDGTTVRGHHAILNATCHSTKQSPIWLS